MAYRVELTARALRDLRHIYRYIQAADSLLARRWFNGLQSAVFSLDEHPSRHPQTPEDVTLRQLLYGNKPHRYRIIYEIHESTFVVRVMFIRHGAQAAFKAKVMQ